MVEIGLKLLVIRRKNSISVQCKIEQAILGDFDEFNYRYHIVLILLSGRLLQFSGYTSDFLDCLESAKALAKLIGVKFYTNDRKHKIIAKKNGAGISIESGKIGVIDKAGELALSHFFLFMIAIIAIVPFCFIYARYYVY